MFIYRLVLTDGTVFECGKPWPGADGKPFTTKGPDGKETQLPAHIWLIMFCPDSVESYADLDEKGEEVGPPVTEQTPAHYKVLMRGNKGSGIDKSKETQVYTVWKDQVKFDCEVWETKDAYEEFAEILGDVPNNGKASAESAQAAAATEG